MSPVYWRLDGAKDVDGVASKFGACRESRPEFRCEE